MQLHVIGWNSTWLDIELFLVPLPTRVFDSITLISDDADNYPIRYFLFTNFQWDQLGYLAYIYSISSEQNSADALGGALLR